MDLSFETPNLAQFEEMLLAMGTKAARAAGRASLRQGANVITQESRRLATAGHPAYPNKITGRMVKAIYTHDRGIVGDNIIFSIDVRPSAFWARFVEFGTSHSRAYPFMRPAAETKAGEAVETLSLVLGQKLHEYWGVIK
jgi:HK97 gp10 family phage protein